MRTNKKINFTTKIGSICSVKNKLNILNVVVLFVAYLLLPNICTAQTYVVDSLENELANITDMAQSIYLMNELSHQLADNDPKKSFDYANKAMEQAIKTNNKEQEVKANFNIGLFYYDSSNQRDSSILFFEKGERMAEEFGYKKLQSDLLMRVANYYRYRDIDSTKTVDYLLKSVEVSKAVDYHYGTGRSYAKLASFYTKYKQVQLCEDYLELAAEYFTKVPNGLEDTAHYYDEVGNKIWDYYPKKSMDLYFKGIEYLDSYPNLKVSLAKAYIAIDQPENALLYLNEALELLKTTRYPRVKGIALAKLAEVYLRLGNFDDALEACNNGIALLRSVSRTSKSALPALYRTKASLMEKENNTQLAIDYFEKSIAEGYKINELFDVMKSNISLGNFYESRNIDKAKKHCDFALKGAVKNNFTSLEIDACDCLYRIYKEKEIYSTALGYFEQRNQLSDSLSTLKVEYALNINDQIAQKDQELAQESYLKELKDEQLNNQVRITTLLFFSSLIGFLLIGFLLRGLKRIRIQNAEINKKTNELQKVNINLERSNEELERFAYVASHDLKSPLRSIISFAGLIRKKVQNQSDDPIKEHINIIENNGKRMSRLIDDILNYSKLSGENETEHEVISLNKLVDEISILIQQDSNDKSIKIEVSNLPALKWNYSKIFLLFKNFIENGLKYNESVEPIVKLYYTNKNGINLIHIEDNGIGINSEYFDKIFQMFQRLHNQEKYEGTGLGLATCKKIVDEFEGELQISSQEGKGTIFKIEIPAKLIVQEKPIKV